MCKTNFFCNELSPNLAHQVTQYIHIFLFSKSYPYVDSVYSQIRLPITFRNVIRNRYTWTISSNFFYEKSTSCLRCESEKEMNLDLKTSFRWWDTTTTISGGNWTYFCFVWIGIKQNVPFWEVAVDQNLEVCPSGQEFDQSSCLDLPNVDSKYKTGGRADNWSSIGSGCFRNSNYVVYYNVKSPDSRYDWNHPLLCRPGKPCAELFFPENLVLHRWCRCLWNDFHRWKFLRNDSNF